jgi:hypothetical protein
MYNARRVAIKLHGIVEKDQKQRCSQWHVQEKRRFDWSGQGYSRWVASRKQKNWEPGGREERTCVILGWGECFAFGGDCRTGTLLTRFGEGVGKGRYGRTVGGQWADRKWGFSVAKRATKSETFATDACSDEKCSKR